MGDSQVYEETFVITSIDSSKYDRVSRLSCTSAMRDTSMTLDVNTEIYPCSAGETIQLMIATTLSLDGSKQDSRGWRDLSRSSESTLADMYDYVCRGKVYKFEQGDADTLYAPSICSHAEFC